MHKRIQLTHRRGAVAACRDVTKLSWPGSKKQFLSVWAATAARSLACQPEQRVQEQHTFPGPGAGLSGNTLGIIAIALLQPHPPHPQLLVIPTRAPTLTLCIYAQASHTSHTPHSLHNPKCPSGAYPPALSVVFLPSTAAMGRMRETHFVIRIPQVSASREGLLAVGCFEHVFWGSLWPLY